MGENRGHGRGSLLALLDDIASVLDDVAVLSKVAAKKTAGVLGDDLALNAQQLTGFRADRELPVVWAVAKGSLVNKAILVPAALAISAFAPWAVTPLLMVGGAFLCYEGFEKIAHRFLRRGEEPKAPLEERARQLSDPAVDLVALERDKIKGAVRTDFILSAEIVAITLGTVAGSTVHDPAGRAGRHRGADDRGRLRLRRRHRQARRPRPVAEPPWQRLGAGAGRAASCAPRPG